MEKITISTETAAQIERVRKVITPPLESAEQNGRLDFPFNVQVETERERELVLRAVGNTFTVTAPSGESWAYMDPKKLKAADYTHIAGALYLTYEELGKLVAVMGADKAKRDKLAEKLGINYAIAL